MRACAAMALVLAGCVTVTAAPAPLSAFAVPPDSAAKRVRQSRRYDTRDEALVLKASGALLMDLGFVTDKSDETLGVLVASKDRSAVEIGQIAVAALIAAFTGADVPYDERQKMRASVVTHPSGRKSIVVRVTFQRIVWNTHGQISKREQLDKPEYYDEFFEKLSKSLLLEAHDT
ncbi:MAG TPA: hypothetical protein VFY93_06410 [Planctomycetota bacterium]|nr:hypothetical protein [Planctomycetota bacterium]